MLLRFWSLPPILCLPIFNIKDLLPSKKSLNKEPIFQMSLQEKIQEGISHALGNLFDHSVLPSDLSLQPTRKEFQGTYTFVLFSDGKITRLSTEESGIRIGEF